MAGGNSPLNLHAPYEKVQESPVGWVGYQLIKPQVMSENTKGSLKV